MDWIDKTIDVVRTANSPKQGWQEMIQIFEIAHPSPAWRLLPITNIDQDITDAKMWLNSQLTTPNAPQATGLYLGLDTLNMEGSDGYNVEIALTDAANPIQLESDWIYTCPWYGQSHLIRGLHELKAQYDQSQWNQIASEADYIIPLGYSGLVLTAALEQLQTSSSILAVWGFHDGDTFFLGRQTTSGFERICQVT